MRLKQFLEDFTDAVRIARERMKHPDEAEIMVRLANGMEFSPGEVKVKRGKVIICEQKGTNGNGISGSVSGESLSNDGD